MQEIKIAICGGRILDDNLWMNLVHFGFDEKAMTDAGCDDPVKGIHLA